MSRFKVKLTKNDSKKTTLYHQRKYLTTKTLSHLQWSWFTTQWRVSLVVITTNNLFVNLAILVKINYDFTFTVIYNKK